MSGYRTAMRTHAGHVRTLNEDSAMMLPERGLWAVADGMGGHHRGDHASSLVTSRLASLARTASGRDLFCAVAASLGGCHHELKAVGIDGEICGCTVVVLLASAGRFACLWAGDSRLYVLRDGRLQQLTRDDSLVQELIDRAELHPAAARGHPWRNMITRAVGVGQHLELGAVQDSIQPGDRFLLCTDGLTGEVEDDAIEEALASAAVDAAADRLLALTLTQGARDNVTLMVVDADVAVPDPYGAPPMRD
jgi:serine/threonine protein phosphatase PrpC